jgi:hypothetical protein
VLLGDLGTVGLGDGPLGGSLRGLDDVGDGELVGHRRRRVPVDPVEREVVRPGERGQFSLHDLPPAFLVGHRQRDRDVDASRPTDGAVDLVEFRRRRDEQHVLVRTVDAVEVVPERRHDLAGATGVATRLRRGDDFEVVDENDTGFALPRTPEHLLDVRRLGSLFAERDLGRVEPDVLEVQFSSECPCEV